MVKVSRFSAFLDIVVYRYLTRRLLRKALMIVTPLPALNVPLRDPEEVKEAELALKALKLRHWSYYPAKVWDGYRFFSHIIVHFPTSATIIEMGSGPYANVLDWLQLYGYRRLWALDLIFKEPKRFGRIQYLGRNLLDTGFPDHSVDCIICQSVIEHAVDLDSFLGETTRILKPGGVLFLSTDYWPDKIDTSGLTMFGVPWSIFSSHQVTQFVEKAKLFGLRLDGPLILLAKNPVIDFLGRRYTFLALEFQKIA